MSHPPQLTPRAFSHILLFCAGILTRVPFRLPRRRGAGLLLPAPPK